MPDSLASDILGAELKYNVFLPAGYAADRGPYPLLLLLHGAGTDEQWWAGQIRLWRAIESGVASGRVPAPIVVMPGGRGLWWCDSAAGRMETALVTELLPDIWNKYPVMTGREGRAVAGYSAGAYGALRLALKHPGLFGAASLWAPAIYAEEPPALSAARRAAPFLGPDGTFELGLWRERNWPMLLPAYLSQAQRVPMYIAAGDDDRLDAAFEAALLARTLSRTQPDALELRVVDGGHSPRVWESTIDEALGFMASHMMRIGLAQKQD